MTPRQRQVLAAILEWRDAYGRTPSTRELAVLLGVSHSRAFQHVVRLRTLGALRWETGMPRSRIVVADGAPSEPPRPAGERGGGTRLVVGFGVT